MQYGRDCVRNGIACSNFSLSASVGATVSMRGDFQHAFAGFSCQVAISGEGERAPLKLALAQSGESGQMPALSHSERRSGQRVDCLDRYAGDTEELDPAGSGCGSGAFCRKCPARNGQRQCGVRRCIAAAVAVTAIFLGERHAVGEGLPAGISRRRTSQESAVSDPSSKN